MNVKTSRFGTIEVDDSSIIKMRRGPLGFEEQTDYILLQHRPDTSFRWLQSLEEPSLAFVVVDPSDFFTDYDIEIPDSDAEALHLEKAEDAIVLSVVTLGANAQEVTANLAAPIVINSKELIGMQAVLQDNRYSVRHPLVEKTDETTAEQAEEMSKAAATVKAA